MKQNNVHDSYQSVIQRFLQQTSCILPVLKGIRMH